MRPKVRLVLDLNQLGGDADVAGIAPNAALQHVLDAQFTTDLRDGRLAVRVMHYGGPCDDAQMLRIEASELGNQLLGEAVTEVVLPSVASEVVKRQHRQHSFSVYLLGEAILAA